MTGCIVRQLRYVTSQQMRNGRGAHPGAHVDFCGENCNEDMFIGCVIIFEQCAAYYSLTNT